MEQNTFQITPMHFKAILRMTQRQLLNHLGDYLCELYADVSIGDKYDFLYASGTLPVLLVAHLDTVHRSAPRLICHDERQRVYWSPEGIGGDDRCGVWLILRALSNRKADHLPLPHVLFTTDEETGGVGARSAAQEIHPHVKYIVELDRQGCDDAVFYACGNGEFQKHIERYGFKKSFGTFSDISILSPKWDIASVNLSCGYYNAHTSAEYIMEPHMDKVYTRLSSLLCDVDAQPFYDYKPVVREYHDFDDDLLSYYSRFNGGNTLSRNARMDIPQKSSTSNDALSKQAKPGKRQKGKPVRRDKDALPG